MAFERCVVDRRLILGGAGVVAAASILRLDAAAASPLALTAAPGRIVLRPGTDTAVLAFSGTVPGPLIRVKLGADVEARLVNKLDQPLMLCWPGVRVSDATAGFGGLDQAAVKPGDSVDERFKPRDAGLFWYRPRLWPNGADLISRGLYGVLIVDEPSPPPVDADLLLVIDEWRLGPGARIEVGGRSAETAKLEPLLTVNSKALPMLETVRPGARVRLRLLNACCARLAVVRCAGMASSVIAVDGQPSGLFEPARGTVPIGPGSRFELMVNLPRDAAAEAAVMLRMDGEAERPLLRFALKGEALPARGPVAKLPDNPLLPTRIPLERSLRRELVISEAGAGGGTASLEKAKPGGGSAAPTSPGANDPARRLTWSLAGRPVDGLGGKPLFVVKRGAAITLAFRNDTDFAQQVILGGHSARILHDLDDGWDPYWRDTVLVGPHRTKHIAFIADNPGRWTVDAVTLDHSGPGLAGFFTVEAAR